MFRKGLFVTNLLILTYLSYIMIFYPVVNKPKVDIDLQPYVDSYFSLLQKHCPKGNFNYHHDIRLFDTQGKETWIGVCRTYFTRIEILVDQLWFYGANEDEREQLIFHEMAHCFIDKEHVEDRYNYMYKNLAHLQKEMYTEQAIEDIREYCKNE